LICFTEIKEENDLRGFICFQKQKSEIDLRVFYAILHKNKSNLEESLKINFEQS